MSMLRKVMFATLMLAMASATVLACICADRPGRDFAEADDVFIGKVVHVDGSEKRYTTFEVLHWLKGDQRQLAMVSGSPCDVWFTKGSTYIVYAREVQNRLMANSCAGTRVIDQPYQLMPVPGRVCDNYERPPSYRIGVITALSVTFSISFGLFQTTV